MSELIGYVFRSSNSPLGVKPTLTVTPNEPRLLCGREIRLRSHYQPPGVASEDQTNDWMCIGIVFGLGTCGLSYRRSSGEIHEQRLVCPQLYVAPPGIPHAARWETKAEFLGVDVEGNFWRRVAKKDLAEMMIVKEAQHDALIWNIASLCRRLFLSRAMPDPEMIDLIGGALTCHIGMLISAAPGQPPANLRSLTDEQRQRVLNYMGEHLRHDIHVDDLAKQIGKSPAHFTELFTNTMGQSPFRYLKELRMRTAYDLLANGAQTLREVAHFVGYLDLEHFREVFRKFWGCNARDLIVRTRTRSANHPMPYPKRPDNFRNEQVD